MADRIWHEQASPSGKPARFESSVEAWAFYNELERLSPNNDTQRSLQSRAIAAFTEGAQMRLQLFTQAGSSIPTFCFHHGGIEAQGKWHAGIQSLPNLQNISCGRAYSWHNLAAADLFHSCAPVDGHDGYGVQRFLV